MARVLVAGGAGFLGSHLVEALLARGDQVVAVDDLSTGRWANLAHIDSPQLERVTADICDGAALTISGELDAVLNFASPASPPAYLARPLETLAVGSHGTEHLLELAHAHGARFLMASTSEVYGDPLVHPQPESYWGNVNPVGPRSVYDEAKRFSEALVTAWKQARGLDVRIVRIFNTYGPRMRADDGRVVSNFICQALRGEPLTIYGDGTQTRSFCYVDDEVAGILALLDSDLEGPVNIGNPDEFTIAELAGLVTELVPSSAGIVHHDLPTDDPTQRRPDIARAAEALGWAPTVDLRSGLAPTIAHFARELGIG